MNNTASLDTPLQSRAQKWDKCFDALKNYYETTGNYDVPSNYVTDDGVLLGFWCANIRKRYKLGLVAKDKIDRLAGIGFDFTAVPVRKWMSYYDCAVRYFKENGDLNVPYNYVSEDGCALGSWIPQQRLKYRNGELSQKQVKLLEKLGIVWNPAQDTWSRNYELVRDYYIKHGRHIKYTYLTDSGYALGVWLKNQYNAYYAGRLSAEQMRLMEQIYIVAKPVEHPIRTDNVSPAGGAV